MMGPEDENDRVAVVRSSRHTTTMAPTSRTWTVLASKTISVRARKSDMKRSGLKMIYKDDHDGLRWPLCVGRPLLVQCARLPL
jgi:hypothetical protein